MLRDHPSSDHRQPTHHAVLTPAPAHSSPPRYLILSPVWHEASKHGARCFPPLVHFSADGPWILRRFRNSRLPGGDLRELELRGRTRGPRLHPGGPRDPLRFHLQRAHDPDQELQRWVAVRLRPRPGLRLGPKVTLDSTRCDVILHVWIHWILFRFDLYEEVLEDMNNCKDCLNVVEVGEFRTCMVAVRERMSGIMTGWQQKIDEELERIKNEEEASCVEWMG